MNSSTDRRNAALFGQFLDVTSSKSSALRRRSHFEVLCRGFRTVSSLRTALAVFTSADINYYYSRWKQPGLFRLSEGLLYPDWDKVKVSLSDVSAEKSEARMRSSLSLKAYLDAANARAAKQQNWQQLASFRAGNMLAFGEADPIPFEDLVRKGYMVAAVVLEDYSKALQAAEANISPRYSALKPVHHQLLTQVVWAYLQAMAAHLGHVSKDLLQISDNAKAFRLYEEGPEC